MSLVIALLMIAGAAAFVVAPFFANADAAASATPAPRARLTRQMLEQRKLDAYAVIKEAEFDYRMGKLSAADFAAVRTQYTAQALDAIAALDASPAAEASPPVPTAFCPACGQAAPRRANFCPACGLALKPAAA